MAVTALGQLVIQIEYPADAALIVQKIHGIIQLLL